MSASRPPMTMDTVLATTRGLPVTTRDAVTQIKLKGQFRDAICELIEARAIVWACEAHGIVPGAAELAESCARQRSAQGLGDEVRFQRWLQLNGVTGEQWLDRARTVLLRDLLKAHVVNDAVVEQHFLAQRDRLAEVSLGRLVVRGLDEAEQIKRQLADDPGAFEKMARASSEDPATRASGGFIGTVRKGMLPPDIEAAVFAAAKDDILGPFHEPNGLTLYKIYGRDQAALDKRVLEMLREQIFAEWLRHEVYTMPA